MEIIMATLQIRVDDLVKKNADQLFASLGLDTSTAVRMFLNAAIEFDGIPFAISHRRINKDTLQAIEDARLFRNLHGPYDTGEEAVKAMLED
jgi:DNA-damage-inducible protein J